ncbi:recombinase family protein [Aquirufa nivalisilvae]|uniref:recombinase family protein n=1 Tax=Aquirufa nivalisilvae TaxID=2516557 RepID=UPI0022A91CC3|nr:recombinase family protein [Aquirufa nivalisilvae]MCZ2481298.1 recombinase family protein [Aquirufa nivalisilvae]
MKVFYSRTSTTEQNPERQLQNLEGFDYVFVDQCSGTIPLYERPKGSQIKKLIDQGKLVHLELHDITRLGRSTLDCLSVYKELTEKGIRIVSRNPYIRNIDDNGKPDSFSECLISLIVSLGTYERQLTLERQKEGIKIRKEKGLYTGRQVGTIETPEKFISKPKNKKILSYLNKGYSYNDISSIIPCSKTTIVRVKKLSQMVLN